MAQNNCDIVDTGLGCDAMWFCAWLLMFRRNVLPMSKMDIGNHLQAHTTAQFRRPLSTFLPLWELHISDSCVILSGVVMWSQLISSVGSLTTPFQSLVTSTVDPTLCTCSWRFSSWNLCFSFPHCYLGSASCAYLRPEYRAAGPFKGT